MSSDNRDTTIDSNRREREARGDVQKEGLDLAFTIVSPLHFCHETLRHEMTEEELAAKKWRGGLIFTWQS
jgi:hypothetical protein